MELSKILLVVVVVVVVTVPTRSAEKYSSSVVFSLIYVYIYGTYMYITEENMDPEKL